jgi:UDP-GlcNAc:undecaprenyl-phosphate GlcNAc-1-phosphate transferase
VQLFCAFLVALSITAALIPLLARYAPSVGLTDRPGPRKVHSEPVPRVGGIAMAFGILAPACLLVSPTPAVWGLLGGTLILLVIGVWDDRRELGWRPKLIGQVAAVALCIVLGGVRIHTYVLDETLPLPQALSLALTFFFLLGVTNAVNLSDGLDGLAGGMALLCFCAIALLAVAGGNHTLTALALIEAGALLGFLRFNTHPARVFMGDGGSQVLGFTIGVLAILATQSASGVGSAALPLLLVGMPIIDTAAVILHRLRVGRSPFTSDRNHLHHRLLALGFTHVEAVALLYLSQLTLFLLAYFLRFAPDLTIVATFCGYAFTVLGAMHWADRSHWRAHASTHARSGSHWLLIGRQYAPRASLWVMGACLVAYAASVIAVSGGIGADVILLSVLLLVPLVVATLTSRAGPVGWLERAAAYVSVVLLVYLDEAAGHGAPLFAGSSWALLAITGVAALVRLALSPARRFQLTSLDLLVVFIALVVPNLPQGAFRVPADLPAGIAKTVILLYVVEMLLSVEGRHRLPRACLFLVLTAVAARGLMAHVA